MLTAYKVKYKLFENQTTCFVRTSILLNKRIRINTQ